jgi:predicted kinase
MFASSIIGYIFIGLPGSGKSTLAHQLEALSPNHQIVSSDQIRQILYGKASIQGDWSKIEDWILEQIQQALAANKTVIYDATNYNRRHRIDFLEKLAKFHSIRWIGVYLKTPIEVCKIRNKQRDRQVPEEVIEIMDECLRTFPPNVSEGFSKIYEIGTNTEEFLSRLA